MMKFYIKLIYIKVKKEYLDLGAFFFVNNNLFVDKIIQFINWVFYS